MCVVRGEWGGGCVEEGAREMWAEDEKCSGKKSGRNGKIVSLDVQVVHVYVGEISRRNFVVRFRLFVRDPKRGVIQKGGWQPRAAE